MSKYRHKFNYNQIKKDIRKTETQQKKDFSDSRFWKLTVGQDHKGSALIRFLPDPETGNTWKKYFNHAFMYDSNKWYIKNCAKTNGWEENCPICDKVREYYDSPHKSDKQLGKERKRNVRFISNILVIKDPGNPENEGKVFLFDYGPQIQKLYAGAMFETKEELETLDAEHGEGTPEYEEALGEILEEKYVPCDFDEGANFSLTATPQMIGSKQAHTYAMSKFRKQSPLFNDLDEDERDEEIDRIMDTAYKLDDFPAADSFPTPAEIRTQLGAELGVQDVEEAEEDDDWDEAPAPRAGSKKPVDEDDEDDLDPDQMDDGEEPKPTKKIKAKTSESVEDFLEGI